MKNVTLFILLSLLIISCDNPTEINSSSSNTTKFFKTFPSNQNFIGDLMGEVFESLDGGYIFHYRNVIMKTNNLGEIEWEIPLLNDTNMIVNDSNGIYYYLTDSGIGRFYGSGVQITTPSTLFTGGDVITISENNELIIGYDTQQPNEGMKLTKFDNDGNMIWGKSYVFSGDTDIHLSSFKTTKDNGFVICGGFNNDSNENIWVFKIDSEGNEIFNKSFDFNGRSDSGRSIYSTIDGGFIFTGIGDDGVWVVKTSSSGVIEWEYYYYSEGGEDGGMSIIQTIDGNYVLTGYEIEVISGEVIFYLILIKIDKNGNELWIKRINNGIGISVNETTDNGLVILGIDFSSDIETGEESNNLWLIKTDENGNY